MAEEETKPLLRMPGRITSVKDNVQKIDSSRPYAQQAIQTAILSDMAGFMEDVMLTLKEQIPEGTFRPLIFQVPWPKALALNQLVSIQGQNLYLPWIAFDIHNDGPSPIYMTVNSTYEETNTPIYPTEHLRIEMKVRQISDVIIVCVPTAADPTPRATVRIFAVR
jgi:hypothetical protein